MFSRELEVNGSLVEINQVECGDTGVVVWDAALVLAKYLELISGKLSGKSVVELGSGTGAVGLVASVLGANVNITDLEENLKLMNHNIKVNENIVKGKLNASVLKWGDKDAIKKLLEKDEYDFILVADCVYYKESLVDLVYTLRELSNKNTEVLISYEDRDSQIKIQVLRDFKELMLRYFTVKEIPLEDQNEEFRSPDIHILSYTPLAK